MARAAFAPTEFLYMYRRRFTRAAQLGGDAEVLENKINDTRLVAVCRCSVYVIYVEGIVLPQGHTHLAIWVMPAIIVGDSAAATSACTPLQLNVIPPIGNIRGLAVK
jgi:hypothetical protein